MLAPMIVAMPKNKQGQGKVGLLIPQVSSSTSAHLLHIMELLEHTLTSRRSCIGLFQTTRNVIVLKLWQTQCIEVVSIYHLQRDHHSMRQENSPGFICHTQ